LACKETSVFVRMIHGPILRFEADRTSVSADDRHTNRIARRSGSAPHAGRITLTNETVHD
jgi:hypothetical protein